MSGIDWHPQLQTVQLNSRSIEIWIPDPLIAKTRYDSGEITFPYWSRLWSSAIALANFLADNPKHSAGKNVLELGAGLGLPSLVVASNSRQVIASDKEAAALEMIRLSAAHHQFNNIETRLINWMEPTAMPHAELVLLSDVNYDAGALQRLQQLLEQFRNDGVKVILATPQRIVAREFIAGLVNGCAEHHTLPVQNENGQTLIELLVL